VTGRPLDPNGPEYGITDLQQRMLTRYGATAQNRALPWPTCPREGSSVRALVRRRMLLRNGTGLLYISPRGDTALSLRAA
jgi:hypothetical protein